MCFEIVLHPKLTKLMGTRWTLVFMSEPNLQLKTFLVIPSNCCHTCSSKYNVFNVCLMYFKKAILTNWACNFKRISPRYYLTTVLYKLRWGGLFDGEI